MRFAHLADCHIGSWRDPKLRDISARAFAKAVDMCIEENVDFILIAGDLFHTSLPSIDLLKMAVSKLKELKDRSIPVYIVAGSHDYSPSGKTMLDVLEKTGLFYNVAKTEESNGKLRLNFTIDAKTNAKITGLLGMRAGLEKGLYQNLALEELEKEHGYKIFLFHALLSDFKPESLREVISFPLSLLPKNFNYYAGGHPHFVFQKQVQDYGTIAYPGPLFPNNFKELEDLGRGGFYIVENNKAEWHPVQVYNTFSIKIDANGKVVEQVEDELMQSVKGKELVDTIVTIRLEGILNSGKPSDIDFKRIFALLYGKGAYFVMKNNAALVSKEFEELKVDASHGEDIEDHLLQQHLDQNSLFSKEHELATIKQLMKTLANEKAEGEKNIEFERRIVQEVDKILEN